MNPEVQHALELAQKYYGKNLEGAMPSSRVVKKRHQVHPQKAHFSGQEAKRKGYERISPYYQREGSDHFWYAGYDGKTMQEAIATQ